MKKLIFKSFVVIFLLLAIANYLIYLNTGNVVARDWWVKLMDFKTSLTDGVGLAARDAKKMEEQLTESKSEPAKKIITLYKWKDSTGQVHFSNTPVAGASEVTVDTSSVLASPEKLPAQTGQPASATEKINPSLGAAEDNKTPIEKARELSKSLNQRNEQLNDAGNTN